MLEILPSDRLPLFIFSSFSSFSVRPPLENEIRISWEGRVNFRCRRPRFRALVGAGILISRVGHVTYGGKGRCEYEGTRMASNEAMLIGAKTAASARSII